MQIHAFNRKQCWNKLAGGAVQSNMLDPRRQLCNKHTHIAMLALFQNHADKQINTHLILDSSTMNTHAVRRVA